MKLEEIRKKINLIDRKILFLIKERLDLAKKAKNEKVKHGLKVTDKEREKEIFSILNKFSDELKLDNLFIKSLYKKIIRESKRIQDD